MLPTAKLESNYILHSNKLSPKQARETLIRLKAKGLYSGDTRKGHISAYGLKLADKFSDVASGRAQVVTVPRRKGIVTAADARATARQMAEELGGAVRSVGRKLIVRTSQPNEKVVYSSKTKTLKTRITNASGKVETHEYVRPKDGERLPKLRDNESYALPFSRGRDGIEYKYRATEEEIEELAHQYESGNTQTRRRYRNAAGHVMIVYEGKRRKGEKRTRAPKASNVVPFKRRGK